MGMSKYLNSINETTLKGEGEELTFATVAVQLLPLCKCWRSIKRNFNVRFLLPLCCSLFIMFFQDRTWNDLQLPASAEDSHPALSLIFILSYPSWNPRLPLFPYFHFLKFKWFQFGKSNKCFASSTTLIYSQKFITHFFQPPHIPNSERFKRCQFSQTRQLL